MFDKCKSDDQIIDYIKDVEVNPWAIYEKVDLSHHDESRPPVDYVMDSLSYYLVDFEKTFIQNMFMRR